MPFLRLGTRFRRLLNIKSHEMRPAFLLTTYYFFITAVVIFLDSAGTELFFEALPTGRTILPLEKMAVAVVSFFVIEFLLRLTGRLPLASLVAGTTIISAASLLALNVLQITYTNAALPLLILVDTVRLIIFIQFWLLANEVFDTRQAKRIFGLLGIGGAVAGVVVGVLLTQLRLAAASMGETGLNGVFAVGVLLMLPAALLAFLVRGYTPTNRRSRQEQSAADTRPLLQGAGYIQAIMLVTVATIVVATTVDYQFKATLDTVELGAGGISAYLGGFYALLGVLQVLARFFVGRVLLSLGILVGLVALPVAMLGSSVAMLVTSFAFNAVVFTKAVDRLLRYTVHESATELLWAPLSLERRSRAKSFVSGTLTSVVQGLTGLLLFALVFRIGEENFATINLYLTGGLVVICFVWIAGSVVLKNQYVHELMQSIQERRLNLGELRVDAADNEMVQTIERHLRSDNPAEQAFALEVIGGLTLDPWAASLNRLFHEGDELIQEQILTLAQRSPVVIGDNELRDLIRNPSRLTDEAIIAAGERGMDDVMPLLLTRLSHPDAAIRAAAARAILVIDDRLHDEQAMNTLRQMLWSTKPEVVSRATTNIVHLPQASGQEIVSTSVLDRLLTYDELEIRRCGIQLVGYYAGSLPTRLIELLIDYLVYPELQVTIRVALRSLSSEAVSSVLVDKFKAADSRLKAAIVQLMDEYPQFELYRLLVGTMNPKDRLLYRVAVDEVVQLREQDSLPAALIDPLSDQVTAVSRLIYARYILLSQLDDESTLLRVAVETDIEQHLVNLLKLATLNITEIDVAEITRQLEENDTTHLPNTIELLDNVLSRKERQFVIPLLEQKDVTTLAAMGQSHFDDLPVSIEAMLRDDLTGPDAWYAAVAFDYVMRHPQWQYLLGETGVPEWEVTRQLQQHYDRVKHNQEDAMFSPLEKTFILRNSTLFEGVDARQLFNVAQIAHEIRFDSGDIVFREGERGESMYVIAEGAIEVYHDDTHILATYLEGSCLGEIALLDLEPRTASARATRPTITLRLDHKEFYELMSLYPDLMRSVIRLLTAKFRQATDQLLEASAEK